MEKEKTAHRILSTLHKAGYEAYFAGGCVRDHVLGIAPKDFDITTAAHPEKIQALFPKSIPVGVQFGVVLVIEEGHRFEIATFRSDGKYIDGRRPETVQFSSVEEDAKRRDFTINGLYWDEKKKAVLDFVGGKKDIEQKIIRTIGEAETRFLEDHLRMLRAVRFSVQLGFSIHPETWQAIKKHHSLLTKVSAERIRDEFEKILTSENPAEGIRLLDKSGLLKEILPEIERMKGVAQPQEYHPEGDVYVHTLLLMEGLKKAPFALAMGCLLHDVAKPDTFVQASDRIRFHGHDVVGAEMTKKICKRLALSTEQTEIIVSLVAEHLRFKDAKNMKKSTLKRFFSIPAFSLHLELHRLDCLASHGNLEAYHYCKEKWEEFEREPKPSKILTGRDLLTLGLTPGKKIGELLRVIEDQVLEGNLKTKEEAIEYLQKNQLLSFLKKKDAPQ